MYDTSATERYLNTLLTTAHTSRVTEDLITAGISGLNAVADLLANQRQPLEAGQLENVAQLIRELSMLSFSAWELSGRPH